MECMLNRRIMQGQENNTNKISKITLTSNFPVEYGGLGIYAVNPNTENYTAHVLSAPGELTVNCLGGVPFVIYGVNEGGSISAGDWSFFFYDDQFYGLFSKYDVVLSDIDESNRFILPSEVRDFFASGSMSQLFVFPSTVKDYNFVYNFEE